MSKEQVDLADMYVLLHISHLKEKETRNLIDFVIFAVLRDASFF